MVFNLIFASNIILSCFFFFLFIELCFTIPEVIPQNSTPITYLVIPIGIPIEEQKAEMEIQPVTAEAKIRYDLKQYKPFWTSYSSIHFVSFLEWNDFLFHLYFSI